MRKYLFIFMLALSSMFAAGQTPTPIRSGPSLPLTCHGGVGTQTSDVFVLINTGNNTGTMYICTSNTGNGVWTPVIAVGSPSTNGNYVVSYNVSSGATTPSVNQIGEVCRTVGGTGNTGQSTDTVLYSDNACVIDHDRGATAVLNETLPTATTLGNAGFTFKYSNHSTTYTDTITPATGSPAWTINGSATAIIPPGQYCVFTVNPNLSTDWLTDCSNSSGVNITGWNVGANPFTLTFPSPSYGMNLTVPTGGTLSAYSNSPPLILTGVGNIYGGPGNYQIDQYTTQMIENGTAGAYLYFTRVFNGSPTTGVWTFNGTVNATSLVGTFNGAVPASDLSGAVPSANTATQYKTGSCQGGIGDGLNAIPAGTYLQTFCYNDSSVTRTITGVKCFTDNNASTNNKLTVAGQALGPIVASFPCGNATFGAGSLIGTALANTDYINLTFVSDNTAKQLTYVITYTQ